MGIQITKKQAPKSGTRTAKSAGKSRQTKTADIGLGKKFSDKRKEQFYREMHALLTSGVDVRACLDMLAEEYPVKHIQGIIEELRDALVKGDSLSGAMQRKKAFSPYEYHNIRIGEESGSLTTVLYELSFYYKRKLMIQRQFIGAITYPLLTLFVTVGVLYFMLNFVVPMFEDVFKRFGGGLPDITQKVIALSNFFRSYSLFVFIGVCAFFGLIYTQRNETWFRKMSSKLLLKIPVFGGIIQQVYLNRFCLSMKILIAAKTPLIDAMKLTREMIVYYPLETALEAATQQVFKGEALFSALGEHKIFPKRMISMIRVAEEINQLDEMFARLSDQMNEEIEHQTSVMGRVIEPVMIILIALLVGVILIAMYLPLFELSTKIT